jgi:nitrite reductase (NADH) large subunit
MRTVKSCVGTTWCRFGVQDSVAFAIRIENRYKGIRAPHKMKSAVSGCIRECAEAQSKDFGVIATEKGWNVYVCGNGGAKPRHADLLAADLDEDTVIRYLDRFVMYYISTADRLTRTSVWLEKLPGGIDYLRDVIIHDRLSICEELERRMHHLVDTYRCEWAEVVRNPERRARFRHFVNTDEPDPEVELVTEREQQRPASWLKNGGPPANENASQPAGGKATRPVIHLPVLPNTWVKVARASDVPANTGVSVKYGKSQIALFNFAARGQWLACQNMCPHKRDMVLSRGLVGDEHGTPKVACPVHKKTFSLETGEGLSDEGLKLTTFSAKEVDGEVYLLLPSEEQLERLLGPAKSSEASGCDHAACSVRAIGPAQQTT